MKHKPLKELDLTNKCGSCIYFHPIEGTARGECHQWKYNEDVAHNPEHPYFEPVRSRLKCRKYRDKPVTNADMIRNMTDEELAEFLDRVSCGCDNCSKQKHCMYETDDDCPQVLLKWLKEEVKDERT